MAAFYLDEDVAVGLARLLRARGHGAATTRELDRLAARDDEQLLFAARRGWILVTHNRQHYVLLHHAWRTWPRAWLDTPAQVGLLAGLWRAWLRPWQARPRHAGVLVRGHGPPEQLAEAIMELLGRGWPLENQLNRWRPTTDRESLG